MTKDSKINLPMIPKYRNHAEEVAAIYEQERIRKEKISEAKAS